MNEDPMFGLFLLIVLVFGLIVLVAVGIIAAIVWYLLSAITAYITYRIYMAQARATFDDVADRVGVTYPVDDVLTATGIKLHSDDGFDNPAEWMAGTPIGVEENES